MMSLRIPRMLCAPRPLMVRSAPLRASRTMRCLNDLLILRDAAKRPLLRMRSGFGEVTLSRKGRGTMPRARTAKEGIAR